MMNSPCIFRSMVHPCESKIALALNFDAFFKAYSVIFLIFTCQTGARILIYYIGKKYN